MRANRARSRVSSDTFDPVQARGLESGRTAFQAQTVGGQRRLGHGAVRGAQRGGGLPRSAADPCAGRGFTSGEPDLRDSQPLHRNGDQADDLGIGQDPCRPGASRVLPVACSTSSADCTRSASD